jgi:hypothetical protein
LERSRTCGVPLRKPAWGSPVQTWSRSASSRASPISRAS